MQTRGEVGRRVRIARRARGHSVRALGEQLGRAAGTVYRWEQGRRDPSLDDLRCIAAVLDVEIAWLVTGMGAVRSRQVA